MPTARSPFTEGGSKHGVLDRAFTVLDALSGADGGLGLSELARSAGLAKTTTHRIVEVLVSVGAVQRVGQRYFIGPLTTQLGRCWQPDPFLGQAAADPVRSLAGTADAAGVYVLYAGRGRLVAASARGGRCWMLPPELTATFTPLAAAWHVLLVADHHRTPPTPLTFGQWQQLLSTIRDRGFAASDHQEGVLGMSCIAAPLLGDCRHRPAAVTAVALGPSPPPGLTDLVVHTADRIVHRLR